MADQIALQDIRFSSRKAATDALIAVGAKRDGKSFVFGAVRVTVYQRGTNRFALANFEGLEQWYADSAGGSVLADYAAGNVRTVFAG